MSKHITISPTHGVNPTIPICFFCGKEKNEIALLGRLKGDMEAPKEICLDYVPCDHCKEQFAKGVLLVGVVTVIGDERPPIHTDTVAGNLYPTGNYAVVKDDLVKALFTEETIGTALEARRMLIPEDLLQQLLGAAAEGEQGES